MPGRDRRAAIAGLIVGLLLIAAGVLVWLAAPALDPDLYSRLRLPVEARVLPWVLRITELGGAVTMIPIGLVACAWLVRSRRTSRALWLFATVASGRILVELAKGLIARPRPPVAERLADVTSLSFPSSHSAGSMLTVVALCFALEARTRGWVLAIGFSLAIGATRVALGVHWASDVLAGWGCGLAWATACWLAAGERTQPRPNPRG